ncbi:FGGY family carbohydrate kinase [Schnuerera ultunensis]|uniref:FGGY family carbohydrate kinase n=1 Tax=Schnuerera ultunensis TaxID=45497 RepID=UPI00041A2947|nr:FGGY family carbohydrate kinase [Schnuerera ultunensis]
MSTFFLGFDIGTLSSKGVLVDQEGNVVAHKQLKHNILIPKAGYQEQDSELWWEEFKLMVKFFLSLPNVKAKDIKSIGLTGCVPALSSIDSQGKTIGNAIMHTDVRAEKQLKFINGQLDLPITHGFMLPKILWVKENDPERYKKTAKVLVPHGFIGYKLTGNPTIDYDTACIIGGVFNPAKLEWDSQKIKQFGIREDILPTPCPASQVIGNVLPQVAEETGLTTETLVIAGTGDSFASILGGGAFDRNHLMLCLGTSGTIIYANCPPRELISSYHFGPGKAEFIGRILSCGESMNHIRETFQYHWWDELNEGGSKVSLGSEGLFFIPHYKQQSEESFFGLDAEFIYGYRSKHSQFHLYRALIEGIAYNIKSNLLNFDKPIDQINIVGGAANSELIREIISNVLNYPLTFYPNNSTAVGVAFLAGYCSGYISDFNHISKIWFTERIKVKPDPLKVQKYKDLYQVYAELKQNVEKIDELLYSKNNL